MLDAYRKHGIRWWDGKGDPDELFVPDAVLTPLFDGLNANRLPYHFWPVHVKRDELNKREHWPRERTMALTRQVWFELGGPALQKTYDFEMATRPLAEYEPTYKSEIPCLGRCNLKGILFRFSQTLSDPVYMIHEAGHLVAQKGGYNRSNVAELPAFFAQEVGYDILRNTMDDRGEAARWHRLEEFLSVQVERDYGCELILEKNSGTEDEKVFVERLHYHNSAYPLAIYMHDMFKAMKADDRKNVLNLLYGGDTTVTHEQIMRRFGLEKEEDFNHAGIHVGKMMQAEALSLGLDESYISKPAPALKRTP